MRQRILPTLLICLFAAPAGAANLCKNQSDVLFSCSIDKSKKSVSICKADQSVEYRFGTPSKIDLTLPEDSNASTIGLSRQNYATGAAFEINFVRGDFVYTVRNVFVGKPPSEWDEVVVTKGDETIATLSCSNQAPTMGNIHDAFDLLEEGGTKVVNY